DQKVPEEGHLHGLALEIVNDEFAHVAGADAVVDRIVEPVAVAQDGAQPRLADPGHAEDGDRTVRRLDAVLGAVEEHEFFQWRMPHAFRPKAPRGTSMARIAGWMAEPA